MLAHADIGTQCYVDGWGGVQQFAAKRLLEKPGIAWVDASADGFCGISQRSKKPNGLFNQVTRFKLRKTTLGSLEKKEWTRLPKQTPRNPHIRGKKCTDTRCAYGKSAS